MKINLAQHICTSSKCLSKGKHSTIALSAKKQAKGVKYELENDSKINISFYDLDDCVFPKKSKDEKFELCDYVLILQNNKNIDSTYVWVELKKTSDLDKSCSQILNSFRNAISFDNQVEHYARIIMGNINKSNIIKDNTKRLKKEFGNRFDFSSQKHNKDKTSKLYLRN